jgi:RNA polymerase sigma-70 factor, ECF subfamily
MKRSGAQSPIDFARLFAEHRESVRNQLLRLVPQHEVDDALQEVFVKAARALPKFRGDATVATWLHQITRRTALDHLRSRHHHEQQHTTALAVQHESCGSKRGSPAPSVPAEAPQRLVKAEMCGCIREFIGRLSFEYAEVLRLKDIDGLTNAQISDNLGISLDAAKIRLHRARVAMRALVNEDCEVYRTMENTLACDRKGRDSAK